MDILVLGKEFEVLMVVETFSSFIWTERYDTAGDFELVVRPDAYLVSVFAQGNYIYKSNSSRMMIIESRTIKTDPDDGPSMIVKGRSLESLLDRRIVWGQFVFSGQVKDAVTQLVDLNCINTIPDTRRIPGLYMIGSTVPSAYISCQYTGDTVYSAVNDICRSVGFGYRINFTPDNRFEFQLFNGTDRSYNQQENPYIIFSTNFENIGATEYYDSSITLKSVALIGGQGEGPDRVYSDIWRPPGTGLERREVFIDARDISNRGDSGDIDVETYKAMLRQRGNEKMAEMNMTVEFSGEVSMSDQYKYGSDFWIGDIVQIVNEFGMEARSRVTELIYSCEQGKITYVPKFAAI